MVCQFGSDVEIGVSLIIEVSGGRIRSIIPRTWKRPPRRLRLRIGGLPKIGSRPDGGCGSWPLIWMFIAALPKWSPASKRGMAGRSAESGGLRAPGGCGCWRDLVRGRLLIVAPHQAEIDAIVRDVALFSELPVAKFPAWEARAGRACVYDEIYGERLRVLKTLAEPVAPREAQAAAGPGGNRHEYSEFVAAGAVARGDGGGDAGGSRWRAGG